MNETVSAPLKENEHVKELLSILKENGKGADASGLAAIVGYVGSMENQLNRAAEDLKAVMTELNAMREERNHPLRTAIQNAAQSMEANINETRTRLEALKDKIIDGCKQAVAAFKEKGISALNGIAKFFKIKPALQSLQNRLQRDIKHDTAMVAKIESLSTQYHSAGMHLRNVGRALRGKEPITAVKPNGKLAKLAEAPFRADMQCLKNALKDTEKAIASLERLEKAAPQKAVTTPGKDDKPSTLETMKRLAEKIAGYKKEAPVTDKSKHKGAEI